MSYEIFLIDEAGQIQLDTDNIDFGTTFSVADIKDIASRKDNITKQIVFKGTKTNNEAFGALFHLNRVTDSSLSNKIFFNYNPLRTVDCFVYEEGLLLLKGNLRVLEVNISKGNISYATVITGHFIEFKGIIQDKYLSDLDFTDLRHRFSKTNIVNSWYYATESYDVGTDTFSSVPFAKGTGYLYPYIDYGQQFLIADSNVTNADETIFHGLNFRPAAYVKEYFDRIFSQPDLPNWSYEIRGDADFIERFNALIIPNTDEKLQHIFNKEGVFFNTHFQQPLVVTEGWANAQITPSKYGHLLNISNITYPPSNTIAPYLKLRSGSSRILDIERNFKADGIIGVALSNIDNHSSFPVQFNIQLVERPTDASTNQLGTWTEVVVSSFVIPPHGTLASKTVTLPIGERQFLSEKDLAVRLLIKYPYVGMGSIPFIEYDVDFVSLDIPKDSTTPFTAEIVFGEDPDYDVLSPKPPDNVKQMDFLKWMMNLFNLYAYTEKANPRRLIFQKYDDYYAFAGHTVIKDFALNWTNKIDFDNFKLKSNLSIPKSYTFTYKEDKDYINTDYKKKYGQVFGTLNITDGFGVVDTKKVELGFAATPIGEDGETQRKHPMLYEIDGGNKKQLKTVIRILYYNGLVPCTEFSVSKDTYTTAWTVEELMLSTQYPQTTTYWYDSTGVPIEDLNFARSKEYYFRIGVDYVNADSIYSTNYSNQLTELTNPNICTFEANVNLNELDIANLDLRTPVFVDLGNLGHTYFKVLSVEYSDNKTFTRVVLQKVYLGALR